MKIVKQYTNVDVDEDVDHLVRRVKAEVKTIPLPRDYDLTSFWYEKMVQGTSETLLSFIS